MSDAIRLGADRDEDILRVDGLSKSFNGVQVLSDVTFSIRPGEVHGLIGQNGSGKSTLIKILSGYHAPDPGGAVWVRGDRLRLPLDPGEPRRHGMAFVHQDLGLAGTMSVMDNIRVGWYGTSFPWRISWRNERALVKAMLHRFDLVEVRPETPVSRLTPVNRAMVAIVRAVEQLRRTEHGLLVLDEPTASLPRDGVDVLVRAVREVAASMKVGVLFVSHRLDEVLAMTDRVSVLRDGRLVASHSTRRVTEQELISSMLGRSIDDLYPEPGAAVGDVALSARNLTGQVVRSIDLDLRRGEVLGLTGLLGMGQEEIPYLLFGAQPEASGELIVGGHELNVRGLTPRKAMAAAIALLPADRQREGALGAASVAENVSLPSIGEFFRAWRLDRRREMSRVSDLLRLFGVNPPDPRRSFSTLSGGNQQKALIAKWFQLKPDVLLLHEPTQGVDVGARTQIFSHIQEAASLGCAVLLASTEYDDLAHLCDRVIVFRNGAIAATLSRPALSLSRILAACYATG